MAQLQYQATMSLDGFIAGPGGDMSWLSEQLGPNPTVDEVMGQVGALLVGRRTFGGDDPYKGTAEEGKPYGGGLERSASRAHPQPVGRAGPGCHLRRRPGQRHSRGQGVGE